MAATLRDVADRVGLSVTTVSRALNGYDDVAVATRQRIEAAADALGYVPNLAARRLKRQRTDTLGFFLPTLGPRFADPFFGELIAGLGDAAAARGYDLLLSTHAPDTDAERLAYLNAVRGHRADGLIVARTRAHDPRIQLLLDNDFPFVAYGRTFEARPYAYVDQDGEASIRLLTEHMLAQGHRRIALIAAPDALMFARHRLAGYRAALAAAGITPEVGWVVPGDMTQHGGAAAAERLLALSPRPTAIVACNDLMAIGAMEVLQRAGLVVGRDIALGGHDDIPTAAFTNPPLTTVRQPTYAIGRMLCEQLVAIIDGADGSEPNGGRRRLPDPVLLEPTLIVRASSGASVLEETA